jgi:hypothetical protein
MAVAVGTGGFVTKSSGLTRLKAGGSATVGLVGSVKILICGGANTVAVGGSGTAVAGLRATLATGPDWQAVTSNAKMSKRKIGSWISLFREFQFPKQSVTRASSE